MKNEPDFRLLHDALEQASSAIPQEPPEGLSVKLRLEYAKFKLALTRLMSNAIKFQEKYERRDKER